MPVETKDSPYNEEELQRRFDAIKSIWHNSASIAGARLLDDTEVPTTEWLEKTAEGLQSYLAELTGRAPH